MQLAPIEKLTGVENWKTWKFSVKLNMTIEDTFDCVAELPPEEVRGNPKAPEMLKDQRAHTRICNALAPSVMTHVLDTTFAKEAWDVLCTVFEDKGVHRRIGLVYSLFEIKHQNHSSLRSYVMAVKEAVSSIKATGRPMEDEMAAILMLRNLKPEMRQLRQLIERTCAVQAPGADGEAVLQFSVVADELLKEARIEEQEERTTAFKFEAVPAKPHSPAPWRGQHHRGGASSRGRGRGGGGFKRAVTQVTQTGQYGRPQQQFKQTTAPGGGPGTGGAGRTHCTICQRIGSHPTSRCRNGPYPPCRYCKRTNHAEEKCSDQNSGRNEAGSVEPKRFKLGGDAQPSATSGGGPNKWVMNMASVGADNNIVVHDSNKNMEMYVDSAASKTMTGNPNCLHNFTEIPKESVLCAAGKVLQTVGKGTIKVNTDSEMNLQEISNVTYVPGLTSNLLSVSSVSASGFITVFRDVYCEIYESKQITISGSPLLKTREQNGIYKVKLNYNPTNIALKTTVNAEVADILHRRLAHLGKDNLNLLINNKLVDGLPDKQELQKQTCEVCLKSRQTRTSFPKSGARRANNLLELVHSDVCQITDGPSWDQLKYFVTFIDDFSRFTVIALLSSKGQVFEKFKNYKAMVEKHIGKPIKTVRSDNGGEYCSNEFGRFFDQEGIVRQLTVANSPEQDGVAERANRTLCEKARALLKEAGLPNKYWAEAMSLAVYIKNVSPTKAVEGMVPMHAWTGQKPNIGDLRIFGCLASVHQTRDTSKKLGDRSLDCIYMGPDTERKGHKVLNIKTGKIFTAISVHFDESVFPAKLGKNLPPQISHVQEETPQTVDISVTRWKNSFWNEGGSDTSSEDETYSTTSMSRITGDESNTDSESEPNQLGKRKRIPKKFPGYVAYGVGEATGEMALLAAPSTFFVPMDFSEAVNCSESQQWIDAMIDEINSFEKNNVWELKPLPIGGKIVGNRWVFRRKENKDGSTLYRARLVAKGYDQVYGVDFHEVFAPVVRRCILRVLFSTAVNFDLKIDHLDVKTAFLYGDLSEDVYMSQPEGFSQKDSNGKVCKLKKAMYGLKQAARSWYLKADKVLKRLGFSNFADEPCVYTKTTDKTVIIVALYVDDFFVIYNSDQEKMDLVNALNLEFEIKDLGEAKSCLGITLKRNWENKSLILQQEKYIDSILERFGMTNCISAETPMEGRPVQNGKKAHQKKGKKREREIDPECNEEEPQNPIKQQKTGANTKKSKDVTYPYRELIGCLLYLSVNTRPDLAYTVSYLSQFNSCFTKEHFTLAKRVLNYLQGTRKLGLEYNKSTSPNFCITGYADADWAGDNTDYHSYSGYLFTLDGNPISWESRKQKLTALSSCEAEYISVTEASKESLYLNEMIGQFFDCGAQTVTLFNDNQGALDLALSHKFNVRTKHFGVRKHFLRDCIENRDIALYHMSTSHMPADILTKPLDKVLHKRRCDTLKMSAD